MFIFRIALDLTLAKIKSISDVVSCLETRWQSLANLANVFPSISGKQFVNDKNTSSKEFAA